MFAHELILSGGALVTAPAVMPPALASLTPQLLGRPRDQLAVPVIRETGGPVSNLVDRGFSPPEAAMLLAWAYVSAVGNKLTGVRAWVCIEAALIARGSDSRPAVVDYFWTELRKMRVARDTRMVRERREAHAIILTALGEDPTNP